MRWLAAIAIFMSAQSAYAFWTLAKIVSKRCDDFAQREFRGTGSVFVHEGSVYVVTSDHTVLHGNQNDQGVCHSISFDEKYSHEREQKSFTAEYLYSDWSRGLALLKVSEPMPFLARYYREAKLEAYDDKPKSPIAQVEGYPYHSSGLLTKDACLMGLTPSEHLLNVPQVQMVVRGHGEFGMSGGSVSGDSFGGILFYRYTVEKTSTRCRAFSTDDMTTVLLAIPPSVVSTFLKEYFSGAPAAMFFQDIEMQSDGQDSVYTGSLNVSAACGVWGGDECGMLVVPATNKNSLGSIERYRTSLKQFQDANGKLKRLSELFDLGESKKAFVTGFVKDGKKVPVGNLVKFFKYLGDSTYTPVILTAPGRELSN